MADRWSAMLDELARQRAELTRVGDAVGRLTARAVSPDRLVAVTVDARGLLVDLTIEPAALRRHRSDQLADLITGLVRDADDRLRRQRNQVLAAAVQPSPDYVDVRPDASGDR
ncbi:YbaB/EbfC family nucleoid-associated protein [Gordonia sp. CPCC 206044]|uniref:YbaB/EbfC family nucleoid-associated protein n=1 Tax=Gordonia sp. CPCC 206044 TaxID=3140793 RepID=UPI003AF3A817